MSFELVSAHAHHGKTELFEAHLLEKYACNKLFLPDETVVNMISRLHRSVQEMKAPEHLRQILSKLGKCTEARERHRKMFNEFHTKDIDANHIFFIRELERVIETGKRRLAIVEEEKRKINNVKNQTTGGVEPPLPNERSGQKEQPDEKKKQPDDKKLSDSTRSDKTKNRKKAASETSHYVVATKAEDIEKVRAENISEVLKSIEQTQVVHQQTSVASVSDHLKKISEDFFPLSTDSLDVFKSVQKDQAELFLLWAVPDSKPYFLACCLLSGFIEYDSIDMEAYESLKEQSKTFFCSLTFENRLEKTWMQNICDNNCEKKKKGEKQIHEKDLIYSLHGIIAATSVDDLLCDVFLFSPHALSNIYRRTVFISIFRITHAFLSRDVSEYFVRLINVRDGKKISIAARDLEYRFVSDNVVEGDFMVIMLDAMIKRVLIACLALLKLCNRHSTAENSRDASYLKEIDFCTSVESGEFVFPPSTEFQNHDDSNIPVAITLMKISIAAELSLQFVEKGTYTKKVKEWCILEEAIFSVFRTLFYKKTDIPTLFYTQQKLSSKSILLNIGRSIIQRLLPAVFNLQGRMPRAQVMKDPTVRIFMTDKPELQVAYKCDADEFVNFFESNFRGETTLKRENIKKTVDKINDSMLRKKFMG